jgi:hypothetical protein
MDELDLFRDLRTTVGKPSAASKKRAHQRLEDAFRREAAPKSVQARGRLLLLAAIAATAATVLLLGFTVPWSSGPTALTPARGATVLARVSAALAPHVGWILHQRETTRQVEPATGLYGRTSSELWAQNVAPYRFRKITTAAGSSPLELGGTGRPRKGLDFDPQTHAFYRVDALVRPSANQTRLPDAAIQIRDAIATGKARVTGRTTIKGRKAYRIQLRIVPSVEMTAFVDAATYKPLRLETAGLPFRGRASRSVTTIFTYEYLPPTTANARLADIQAKHPTVTTAPASTMPTRLRKRLGLQ